MHLKFGDESLDRLIHKVIRVARHHEIIQNYLIMLAVRDGNKRFRDMV